MDKRLYKSREDKMLFGVCSGVAEYFDIDPTLVRLGTALLILSGAGVLVYIVAAIVMPEKPMTSQTNQQAKAEPKETEVVVEAEEVKDEDISVE